jgi:hypothetical protein
MEGWPKSEHEMARLRPQKTNFLKKGGGLGGGARAQIEIEPNMRRSSPSPNTRP